MLTFLSMLVVLAAMLYMARKCKHFVALRPIVRSKIWR